MYKLRVDDYYDTRALLLFDLSSIKLVRFIFLPLKKQNRNYHCSVIIVTQSVTIKVAPTVSYDAYDANDVYLDNSLLLYDRDVCFLLFRVKTMGLVACMDQNQKVLKRSVS